jgi:tRNA (cytidine/uridine-2'-O-)-methyltransferase
MKIQTNNDKPFHIVLVEPEIPPNTGNIARSCAATGTCLHLVKPLGFDINDSAVRRAGLDYWPFVQLRVHENLAAFLAACPEAPKYFVSTRGKHRYTEVIYEPGAMFLFGKETKGLDRGLLSKNEERTIRIPMGPDERLRSLNLANSANIVLFEALRQTNFPGLV